MKIVPKIILEKPVKLNDYCEDGYCVNCGYGSCKGISRNVWDVFTTPNVLLTLVAHGKIRLVDIDCPCGSTKALHDIDVENFIVYDYLKN